MRKKWLYVALLILVIGGAITAYMMKHGGLMQSVTADTEVSGLGTQEIDETMPTADDFIQAKQVVQQVLDSRNRKDWQTFKSLVYNVHPVPYPPHFFEEHSQKWAPSTYTIGKPYLVIDWATPYINITNPSDSHDPSIYKQNLLFTYAISVPVQLDGELTHLHVVKNKEGQLRVAYSFLQGFEQWDKPEEYRK